MDNNTILEKYTKLVPVPIVALAQELGLKIYETNELKKNESGAIKKEGDDYVIYLNASDPTTRKRFTIAHEIAHFLLHKELLDNNREFVDTAQQPTTLYRSAGDTPSEDRRYEIEANMKAGELLMPEQTFIEAYTQADSIIDLARQYKVSPSAATVRSQILSNSFIS